MEKGKPFWYPNNENLNKEIYAFGLNGDQWTIVGGSILLGGAVFWFKKEILLFAVPLMIVVYFFIGKIRRENRKGNPDYYTGFLVSLFAPKYLIDNSKVFKRIKENGKRL